ncbi:MAG: glycosyl hydrolase [Paludibacter sp.]|nr:glycosyl hydrolase [Paludibacter sp.]
MNLKSNANFYKQIRILFCLTFVLSSYLWAGGITTWPTVTTEMRPGARWWWMGSAVDKTNLTYNLEEYAKAGLGTVEITPIYGVQKNDANEIAFLSEKWMGILNHTEAETKRLGMQTDMNTGTGWPFGGPKVTIEEAASKLLVKQFTVKGGATLAAKFIPDEQNQLAVAKLERLMAFSEKKIKDLTALVDKEGNINWKAPKGDWTVIAALCGKSLQKVKRAAPGGEGYVMDHFSKTAVKNYLSRFSKAFAASGTPYPHNFFNDSYEVFDADWSPGFFDEFLVRRGYKLEEHLPAFLASERSDETMRVVSDYRETLSDMLHENFTKQWTDWAHLHGSKTRNQAHGSPGNLIDLYGTVDVPECESFGLSNFGINGLCKDSLTRKNDSDLSMLKYASSAAHITGKPYTSSETFTWLTEHFRTSLSQCKPDLDLFFVSGVNHCFFHGTTYSPKEAAWPGWKFYASVDMSPTNTIWRDAPAMFSYITRCQSFLQMGKPDNDFLIYLPVYDTWNDKGGRFVKFDITSMDKLMPKFKLVVQSIYKNGFDVDYISDNYLLSAKFEDGKIVTEGGTRYAALILPAVKKIPQNVMKHLSELAAQGASVVFMENYPNDVPGLSNLRARRSELNKVLKRIAVNKDFSSTKVLKYKKGRIITSSDYKDALETIGKQPEEMITKFGLHAMRRTNDVGYHYFISCLQKNDVNDWVTLSVPATSAQIFNPMTGETGKANVRQQGGNTQVYLQLKSGESLILKTFTKEDIQVQAWKYLKTNSQTIELTNSWKLHFEKSEPQVIDSFTLNTLKSWTELDNETLEVNGGTGIYETTFNLNSISESAEYVLNLGDVRESAHVFVNGQDAGTVWAVPYECRIAKWLKAGMNTLRIEVTNLPANRISDYDRRKINWRIFKEINIVDINYKKTGYAHWKPVESGLCSPVKLVVYQ